MYKTGLVLTGLIGGMVMLGGAPALAQGYTTAPVVANYDHDHHDDGDDIRYNRSQDGEWTNNGSDNDFLDLDVLNDVLDILTNR
ncbi:hypothetical protein [Nonomuraea sp. C10]|uniref:hypothetical protein n=1 Tax=Nonomuraea sp. C10 TaxID=2600577 RepID=UPI0011CD3ED8|nr:hypothetical protein [Nonomuraea sp. C10]TXK38654.1 hypothetical protein FR742_02910 [Nonomuraea sp. C10]